jgi:hypothetical protein
MSRNKEENQYCLKTCLVVYSILNKIFLNVRNCVVICGPMTGGHVVQWALNTGQMIFERVPQWHTDVWSNFDTWPSLGWAHCPTWCSILTAVGRSDMRHQRSPPLPSSPPSGLPFSTVPVCSPPFFSDVDSPSSIAPPQPPTVELSSAKRRAHDHEIWGRPSGLVAVKCGCRSDSADLAMTEFLRGRPRMVKVPAWWAQL